MRRDQALYRQLEGLLDRHILLATALAADNMDISPCDAKGIGNKALQVLVGFPSYWRRLEPEFQAVAVETAEFVAAGIGLDMAAQ